MHLQKPALLLAVFLLVGASGMTDELTSDLTQPSPLVSDAAQPQDPSKWNFPPDVTKVDPNCAGANGETFRVTMDSLFWRVEHGGSQLWCASKVFAGPVRRFTDDLDLGFQMGPRLNVTYTAEEGSALEVGYFGVYDWNAGDRAYDTTNKLRVPDSMGVFIPGSYDFSNADSMSITYSVKLNSVEANMAFAKPGSAISGLIGVRFIRYDEALDIRAYVANYQLANPSTVYTYQTVGPGYSDYIIGTKNEMFGLQGGSHAQFCLTDRLEFEGFAKLGVYNNNAQQSTWKTKDNRLSIMRDDTASQSLAAFAADFNASLNYRFNGNWSLRFGYNALIMSGVARATDQLDFVAVTNYNANKIYFREEVFVHGFNLGLEGRF